MPSGYTAIIGDRDDLTFEEFALRCARAMGACIMQRDDSMDELPKLDEPSDYYLENLNEAKAELERLQKINVNDFRVELTKKYEESKDYHLSKQIENLTLKLKYENMLNKVNSWTPPSNDHVEFKVFMMRQITDSIEWDCTDYHEKELAKLPNVESLTNIQIAELWNEAMNVAIKDIKYYSKNYKEEVERTEGRNRWKLQLFESLGLGEKV